MYKTVYCLVCGEPMQRDIHAVQLPLCSKECRAFWFMDGPEREEYMKNKFGRLGHIE